MKKGLAKAAFLTAALIIVAPRFMRGQVTNFNKPLQPNTAASGSQTNSATGTPAHHPDQPLSNNSTQEGKAD
jgi:hypothetical protein